MYSYLKNATNMICCEYDITFRYVPDGETAGLHLKEVRSGCSNGAPCISLTSAALGISYFTHCICCSMNSLFCTWCNRSDCWNGAPCISEPSTPPSLSERPVTVLRVQTNPICQIFLLYLYENRAKLMKICIIEVRQSM